MVDWGAPLLWLALVGALAAVVFPRRGRIGIVVAAWALLMASAALGRALWTLDLSVAYVADHARGSIGAPYRLAGLWGGASGSLLMFTAMLAVAAAGLAMTRNTAMSATAARWGGATVGAFTASVLAYANPFGRLQIPAISGSGLQPILEHPAMLYHPPLLYAGLVSTIVPWIIALTAAHDPDWRSLVRPWLGVSLALLTIGQATGSNWAYVELGWGGFWGWDPVENGVLVAWLFVIVALHTLGQPGHDRTVAWLCSAPWFAVLICTTVTRAGVGDSVHAFADDPRISRALTVLIASTTVVTVVVLWRVGNPRRRLRQLPLVPAIVLTLGAAAVLEGILYPVLVPGRPLVTGHFYATVLGPLAIVALALSSLALGRRTGWRAGRSMLFGSVAGVALGVFAGTRTVFALLVAAGVGAVIANLAVGLLRAPAHHARPVRWSTRIGHLGFAVLLVGVAGSTQADRTTAILGPDDAVEVGGVRFTHRGVEVADGPVDASSAVVATIDVDTGDRDVVLRPELVAFTDRSVLLAETGLDSRPLRDVQVVLRSATDDGLARYDLSVTPLVQAVWWGSVLLALAGAAIVFDYVGPSRLRRRSSRARSNSADIVADSLASSERATSSSNAASSASTDVGGPVGVGAALADDVDDESR